jgi:mRNA interferase MazF
VNRGDIVLMAAGKPRPAVVVQANRVTTPFTILLCPISSYLVDAPLYRPKVEPDKANALTKTSQFMADKVAPIERDKIGQVVGALAADDLQRLDVALAVVLGLR